MGVDKKKEKHNLKFKSGCRRITAPFQVGRENIRMCVEWASKIFSVISHLIPGHVKRSYLVEVRARTHLDLLSLVILTSMYFNTSISNRQ